MAAYLVVRVDIKNWEEYKKYLNVTPAIIEKYGGKALVRAGEMVTLEGPEETRRIVILEFPTMERAKEWYNSEEYQEAKKLREGAAIGEIIAIEGIE
ncbi:DUF1330 domain-containing protein [Candidatus Formimonas warabiya]|uniref:D-fructose-6-phosphate amidotransferase n=1 Tax=Formimonas warabiya TaxID=1761012 RepID=A0A3G1KWB0_FORW1|nr:DUF1330 domain-containing protein [Candidatus Formimonas warabiya]ATW26710.1 D-fructose-6-phosphate amidotransferase [Candidatus Formimonas warabiya]